MATYNVNITISPLAKGTVKVGSTLASGTVQEEGVTVNLLGAPISGWGFVSYVIDGGSPITTASHSFVMPASDVNITATFFELPVPTETEQNSIYDTTCPRFFFIKNYTQRNFDGDVIDISGTDNTQIEEPIGFDAGVFRLERDSKYHGFNYEFSVDSLRYELQSVGYNYLKTQILLGGTDVDIKFVYGFGNPDALTLFYIGKVDMNEYKLVENGEYAEFGLRELDFDNLLQTAFDVPQVVPPTESVQLYSKVIPKRVQYRVDMPQDALGLGLGLASQAWFGEDYRTPDPPGADIVRIRKTDPIGYCLFNDGREGEGDFETFVTYDFQVDSTSPNTLDHYVFEVAEAGVYDISVKFWMGLFLSNNVTWSNLNFLNLTILNKKADGTLSFLAAANPNSILTPTGLLAPDQIAVFDVDLTTEVSLGDQLYIYIAIDTTSIDFPTNGFISAIVAYPFDYDYSIPQIAVIGQTLADTSNMNAIAPYDLINSVCKQASDVNYDILKSSFFDVGGCGSLMYLTNGFNIRGLTNRSISVEPKKLIDMLTNLYCLGWGVEYDEVNRELIVLELADYFYQDVEIDSYTSISNYTKEIDPASYYNEVEIGFANYSKQRETNKGFTVDDFHTKHYYQTPVKTNKNKLSVITDLTLSAYEIEILRRKQFEKDGSNIDSNYREDENIFGIQLTSATPVNTFDYPNAQVSSEDGNITIINDGYDLTLLVGDTVTYTSRAGITQTRVVTYFNVSSFIIVETVFTSTFISFAEELVGATTGVGDISIARLSNESFLAPESSQPFLLVNNVLSPDTTYNLRHTPKRMLYNWAKLINGGFFAKDGSDEILFKQGDGNTRLLTRFNNSETCRLGDAAPSVIEEDGNVVISSFNNRDYLYLPFKVSFSVSLTFEQLSDLKKCLRGQDGVRDYGYVTITNNCNETEKIFITSIEYNPIQDEAKIDGYLKEITGVV